MLLLMLNVIGCDQPDIEGTVLARVNGEPIYESELSTNIASIFGQERERSVKQEERKKILESMVLSRLIRQQAEKELDKDVLNSINRQTEIYKERLIINQYFKTNVKIAPVSEEMIEEYYEKHADEYGEQKQRTYELITAKEKMNELARNKLLGDYKNIVKGSDISVVHKQLSSRGNKLVYRKGLHEMDIEQPRLKALIKQLNLNETSQPNFIDGRPYIVKISSEKTTAATPLAEVRSDIAKKLAPMMMKQAIQSKYTQLQSTSDIEYLLD